MDRLEQLPEITDHALSGLKADEHFKHKILLAAVESGQKKTGRLRTVIALCSLSVLLILLCVFVSGLNGGGTSSELQIIPAGSHRNSAPVNLQKVMEKAYELDP